MKCIVMINPDYLYGYYTWMLCILYCRMASIMLSGRTLSRNLAICLPWLLDNWRAEMTHLLPVQDERCPLGFGPLQMTCLRLPMQCIRWKQLWNGMKMSVYIYNAIFIWSDLLLTLQIIYFWDSEDFCCLAYALQIGFWTWIWPGSLQYCCCPRF